MFRIFTSTIFLVLLGTLYSWGTHLRSADITIERECNSLTVKIHLTIYKNTQSQTQIGTSARVFFGDGTSVQVPRLVHTVRPDLGENIGVAEFETTHTYSANGTYKITYQEGDRSSGVLNIANALDVKYATSTVINLTSEVGCNVYPKLTIVPLDRACVGRTFTHNPGATDNEGDSLSYELLVPAQDADSPVPGYSWPHDPRFYTNPGSGNEAGDGPPTFTIDPITGIITWDAPGRVGEYNIAFRITEWRKNTVTDEFIVLSTTIRDMQIIVDDCDNERPDMVIPSNICVMAGTTIDETIEGFDADLDPVKIEPFSEIFTMTSPATFSPNPPAFTSSDPKAIQSFHWDTECVHVRDQPYQVIYKISDDPAHQTSLVTFKSRSIKVMSPAPSWVSATVDLVKRHGQLKWNNTFCSTADRIQIWRKVGGYNFVSPPCFTGLPAYLGYTLIDEVDPTSTEYTDTGNDKGLAPGAFYCYRLVAVFDNPIAKSIASTEQCIGPIETDAPIITKVSVLETDVSEGKIDLQWTTPLYINKTQFPGPYSYAVYRGIGFESEDAELTLVAENLTDTTFVDINIDTEGSPFNYKVVVYSQTQFDPTVIPIDTSTAASSVRLTVVPGEDQLELTWEAAVPWSNFASENPMHLIYRGNSEANLVLIDSVDVTLQGFKYVDTGSFQNLGIDKNAKYCYRIVARGTYGNPDIALLENASQEVCTYPDNDLPPCVPVVVIDLLDCDEFLQQETCDVSQFINTIRWEVEEQEGCRSDIQHYIISAADNDIGGTYTELPGIVRERTFQEENLESLARCYRVAAVDGKGQISEWSEPVCSDNCPFYSLPNVFTPNGDRCNDLFSSYHVEDVDEGCPIGDVTLCPRFVDAVRIQIFNRWGKEVFFMNSEDNESNSIYVDWNGTDQDGTELEAGVYYYVADVKFDAVDPDKKKQRLKGWVRIIR